MIVSFVCRTNRPYQMLTRRSFLSSVLHGCNLRGNVLLMLQETLDFTGDVLMFLHSFWLKPGVLVVYMYIYIYIHIPGLKVFPE